MTHPKHHLANLLLLCCATLLPACEEYTDKQVVNEPGAPQTTQDDPPIAPPPGDDVTIDRKKEEKADTDPPKPTAPIADVPKTLTDHVLYYKGEKVPIQMVLIPGSEDGSIKPFYIQTTEVNWKMFMRWMYSEDIDDHSKTAELIKADLRPTPMFSEFPPLHLGRGAGKDWVNQPALGMSWRTAQAYCKWLSEQTGRTYRLPTDKEWMYVLELSGGVPQNRDTLLSQSAFADNTEEDLFTFWNIPRTVGQGKPNKLGLYDLLGNAAEWVQPQGGERWVRGGHFMLKADELTADWKAVEDQDVWNETYPQIPRSRFWYIDHFYQGLRLVCEVPGDGE